MKLLVGGFLLLLSFLAPSVAYAENIVVEMDATCAQERHVLDGLLTEFGEQLALRGVSNRTFNDKKMRMSFFVNPETATYTILVHTGTGVVCVIDDGSLIKNSQAPKDEKKYFTKTL